MSLFVIYARATNGAIGKDGQLPWHLPADLRHFKTLTMGRPMIMGRKTFESLPGLLPGRRHIVLTRDSGWSRAGAEIAHSVPEALERAGDGEVAVIGGAAIFELLLPHAERAEVTEIHRDFAGDVFMPPLGSEWQEVRREDHGEEGDRPGFSFVTYRRTGERAA